MSNLNFALEIHNSGAGWLDSRLVLGDEEFEFMASGVSNDPLQELAELGLFLLSDERSERAAVFWLEPDGFELRASRNDELFLAMNYAEDAYRTLEPPIETVFAIPIVGRTVAKEILRARRTIEPQLSPGSHGDNTQNNGWYHPAPLALTARLASALSCAPDNKTRAG